MNYKSIQEIDPNFSSFARFPDGLIFHDVFSAPFHLEGFCEPCKIKKFYRFPAEKMPQFSSGIQWLAQRTAGGRIRFATDSPGLAIAVRLSGPVHMMHMPRTGNSGFDLYVGERGSRTAEQKFMRTFFPQEPIEETGVYYTGYCPLSGEPSEIILDFPSYNGVESVFIGLKDGASVWEPVPYQIEKPVLFYGSSITQGACASRPGNNYIHHLSRWLDFPFICLGFSGSAKGQPEIAEYIATLDLSAFVMAYDYNANTPEELEATHYPFYEIVRKAQPELPIVMTSRPNFSGSPEDIRRREIIMESYLRGRKNGDTHLFFADGAQFFRGADRDACTVDGVHPNDLGFYRIAEGLRPQLETALGVTRLTGVIRSRIVEYYGW